MATVRVARTTYLQGLKLALAGYATDDPMYAAIANRLRELESP